MRRALLVILLAGCETFHASTPPVQDDAGADETLAPCLDQPTDLARPPTGPLTCDLLPPDFQ